MFVSQEDVNPFDIQLHTHKYDLTIGVLCGEFTHHDATYWYSVPISQTMLQSKVTLPAYDYNSNGGYFSDLDEVDLIITNHIVPKYGVIELSSTDVHTVSAKKGTMWVIQEGDMYWSVSYCDEQHLFDVVSDTKVLSRQVKQRMIEDDRIKPTIEQLDECWEDWLKVSVYEDQRFGQYFYNRYQWEVDNSYTVERPRKAYEMLWQSLL